MTQDEIIRMMEEAGFCFGKDHEFHPEWERFADLVAVHYLIQAFSIVMGSVSRDQAMDEIEKLMKTIRARGEK